MQQLGSNADCGLRVGGQTDGCSRVDDIERRLLSMTSTLGVAVRGDPRTLCLVTLYELEKHACEVSWAEPDATPKG